MSLVNLTRNLKYFHRVTYLFPPVRLCSSSSSNTLHHHSLTVPSFGGSLWVKSPYHVNIKPTNTMEYPNLDQAFVQVNIRVVHIVHIVTDRAVQVKSSDDSVTPEDVDIQVTQKGPKLQVSGYGDFSDSIMIEVEVPIVYDVTAVTTGEASIKCRDMIESDRCQLTTEAGNISISGVKTSKLIVQSEDGEVTCSGAVQGSVSINTVSGHVKSNKRFTGPSLDINTESGNINISSCYSDQSKFTTMTGELSLSNVHNQSYVAVYEEGDVKMTGVDGTASVFVKKGNLDLQISNVKSESRFHVEEGDVILKLSDSQPLKVCVTGKQVSVDDKFSGYGDIETKEDNYQHYFGSIKPDQFRLIFSGVSSN